MASPATLDGRAVAALDGLPVDWRHKAMPPRTWGQRAADVVALGLRLSDLPTPLLTLSRDAMAHNEQVMTSWRRAHALDLAPHGKTTMAPQLWRTQLESGAWAITLANTAQLAVARAFGLSRAIVANAVISPLALRWIAEQLAADPDFELFVWG
ncbi:hypothetical protein [Luteipulveratus mongoliensis]|uniref:hypothetical protein n=1 Tax=Luteipulveratus mongoliensis TaxID=571913 RepID=UPI000ADE1BEC|nr:hypothetical protein [Luteipulveratus mongoliensis]